jgi:hypothetical protein
MVIFASRLFVLLAALAVSAFGAEQGVAPKPVSSEHFSNFLNHSPFLRVLSLEKTYALGGIARVEGQIYVTLQHRATKKRITVSSEKENEQGMQLIEVVGSEPENIKVKVIYGGKETVFAYGSKQVSPQLEPGTMDRVRYDSKGRVTSSDQLVKKYLSMSKDQRRAYMKWKEEVQLKARPELRYSKERFPLAHRALDAIKNGKRPN